jgi:hypothetical protein
MEQPCEFARNNVFMAILSCSFTAARKRIAEALIFWRCWSLVQSEIEIEVSKRKGQFWGSRRNRREYFAD